MSFMFPGIHFHFSEKLALKQKPNIMKFIQSALFLFFASSVLKVNAFVEDAGHHNLSRRRLAASTGNLQTCAEVEYTISVAVENFHVLAVADPHCGSLRNDEVCKKCPGFAFHTGTMAHGDNDDIVLGKQIYELSEEDNDTERLPLKKMTLQNVVEAFEGIPVEAEPYSFSNNNCGTIMIQLAAKIGVDPTDPATVEFVSRKLSQQAGGSNMMEEIDEMMDGRGRDAVIEDFVAGYIHARV